MMHRSLGGRRGWRSASTMRTRFGRRGPAGAARKIRAAAGAREQAPKFEVDLMWPKPMPNRWILGSAVGLAVDSRDHVWVVNLTDSFTARTETGRTPTRRSASVASRRRTCWSTMRRAMLVGHWGGPGQGYDWPENESWARHRPRGQRLDRRRRRERFENSKVLAGRKVRRAVRQGCDGRGGPGAGARP